MKKPIKMCAIALAATMMAGCASVVYTAPDALGDTVIGGMEGRKAGEVVIVDTVGYYFLTMPLLSGDLTWNAEKQSIEGGTSFFSDNVGVNELQSALLKIAEARNCDIADIYIFDADASFAGTGYSGLIGMFFTSAHMSISAVLYPKDSAQ